MGGRSPFNPEKHLPPLLLPAMPRRCHQRSHGRSGYRLCHADWRREELNLPITGDHGWERVDGRDQSVIGFDLGSSQGAEGSWSGMRGEPILYIT